MNFENIVPFDPLHTFDCGQCFRWERTPDGAWFGIVDGHAAKVSFKDGTLAVESDYEDADFWSGYFDLKRDYTKIIERLSFDEIMKSVISDSSGIRLLRQSPWETLISFIISQNNNIPRIKKIINALCEQFGTEFEACGRTLYTFPTAGQLLGRDLSPIRAGFRAKYIEDAVQKVADGEVDLERIYSISSDEAREYLKTIKGVGDKVADCVLLFSYQKFDVFPKDVWIKRIVNKLFSIDEKDVTVFAAEKFGEYSGFAQQYLFYHARV